MLNSSILSILYPHANNQITSLFPAAYDFGLNSLILMQYNIIV